MCDGPLPVAAPQTHLRFTLFIRQGLNCGQNTGSVFASVKPGSETAKVGSFPAHQACAELMNPRGPAPALRSEHYSQAKRGGAASVATPQQTAAHTQIMTVELTGSRRSKQHLPIPCGISGELNRMDKQTQTCWDVIELLPCTNGDEGRRPPDTFVCTSEP